MSKMKKEMKELLHHILDSWSYMETEMSCYMEDRDMEWDELDYLYSNLCEHINEKYKLEE